MADAAPCRTNKQLQGSVLEWKAQNGCVITHEPKKVHVLNSSARIESVSSCRHYNAFLFHEESENESRTSDNFSLGFFLFFVFFKNHGKHRLWPKIWF